MYFVKQLNNEDCGFACLKMVMAKAFKRKEFLYLKQDLSHGAYNYKEIIDIAKNHGLRMNGYLYNDVNELFKEKPRNVMVSLQSQGGGRHMVVIKSIHLNRVYIKDPCLGNYSLSKKKFINLWDKTLIRIDDNRGYNKLPIKPYKTKPGDTIISMILRILGIISAILGVFYLDKGIPIYISLTLLAMSFIFEIVYRIFSIKMMKKIDEDILRKIRRCTCKGSQFINSFSQYKQIDVMLYPSFAFSLVMSLFIVVIFVLNNVYNFIPVVFVIVMTSLDTLVIDPILQAKRKEIEIKEQSLYEKEVDRQFIKNFSILNQKSYNFGKLYMMKKIIFSLLLITLVIFYMFISKVSDISYIVFYCAGYWYLSNNLAYILTFKDKLDTLTYYRLILLNVIKE